MRVYPLETVVAEKFAALAELGLLTTRMKDVFDLYTIAGRETFERDTLRLAISRSFVARQTPNAAPVLRPAFANDEVMDTRWRAFLRRTGMPAPAQFREVMTQLHPFLLALLPQSAVQKGECWNPEQGHWE